MQSLKKSSLLQIISALFSTKKAKQMQNIFGNIELIPIQSSLVISSSNKKQHDMVNIKQRKSLAPRHTFDLQYSKKRAQSLKSIQQLKNSIKQTQQKNHQLYARIVTLSPQFTHVLFAPNFVQNTCFNFTFDQEAKSFQQKLLSELDSLYEQNCLLQKQLNRIKFAEQTEDKQKKETLHKSIDHYQFLRNVWYNKNDNKGRTIQEFLGGENSKCEDLVEKLNSKVAMVRNNINLILREQQGKQNLSQLSSSKIEDQFVIKSAKYQKLLKLYEQTAMQLQDSRSYASKRRQSESLLLQKPVQVQQKQDKNSGIYQVQNLKKKIKSLENKFFESQKQISNLKEQIAFKDKQLTTYQKDAQNKIQTQKNTHLQENNLNLDLKRIQKIDHENIRPSRMQLNTIDLNKIKTDRLSLIKKTNKLSESFNGSSTLRHNVSKQRSKRALNCSNQILVQRQVQTEPLNIVFPQIIGSQSLQADLKVKFTRTSTRCRRQSLR